MGERGKELSKKVEARRHILYHRNSMDVLRELNPRFKYMQTMGVRTTVNRATFGKLPGKKRHSHNPCSSVGILMTDMRKGSARKDGIKKEMFVKKHTRPRIHRNISFTQQNDDLLNFSQSSLNDTNP